MSALSRTANLCFKLVFTAISLSPSSPILSNLVLISTVLPSPTCQILLDNLLKLVYLVLIFTIISALAKSFWITRSSSSISS
ncbi:hypothetical protein C8R48DRAFT_769885 [Suillus tomentosus]|nr:hypothetical protein C8R48DRAFT_769885 [Suillus tomentosus]